MNTRITINNIYQPQAPDYDPFNLPRTVSKSRFSYDPIHADALKIIERLNQAQTEGQVRALIWEYFGKYFGADICGAEWDEVKDLTLDLWKYYSK